MIDLEKTRKLREAVTPERKLLEKYGPPSGAWTPETAPPPTPPPAPGPPEPPPI